MADSLSETSLPTGQRTPTAPTLGGDFKGLRDGLMSPLLRRIVAVNLIGLALLVGGVLVLNEYREKLVGLREDSLQVHARIVANVLASHAGDSNDHITLDPLRVALDLENLAGEEGIRAQLFDRAARLTYDNRLSVASHGAVNAASPTSPALPTQSTRTQNSTNSPPTPLTAQEPSLLTRILADLRRDVRSILYGVELEDAAEILGGVARTREVFAALGGLPNIGRRINSRGELIVSSSMPIKRDNMVLGVLVLSTPGGDIDEIVDEGRVLILQVFMLALTVAILTATIMARSVALPIQQLAAAAAAFEGSADGDQERSRGKLPQIPDLTDRGDEIGDLSGALRRMTDSLSTRLEATESFAADVAHEIKNPLTSLRSAVETLRHVERDDARAMLLNVIEHDVIRLNRLLTDISAASRLDVELVRAQRHRFDISAQLTQIVEQNRAEAAMRKIELKLVLPTMPQRIRGLETRVAQIFQNLISNAISFSPPNGIIEIRLTPPAFEGALMTIDVSDEGPGIPLENLEHIFQRFYSERLDHESFGDHSGLGLSISRQIAEAHDGCISASNILDGNNRVIGARFKVELPS